MLKSDLVKTTFHQIHLDYHGFQLQVSLLYGLFQECILSLLVLGAVEHFVDNGVFLFDNVSQLFVLVQDALLLSPLTKNLILQPFHLSSKFSDLLRVMNLLLGGNVLLEFIDFLEASRHLLLIILRVALSDVFHLVFESRVFRKVWLWLRLGDILDVILFLQHL